MEGSLAFGARWIYLSTEVDTLMRCLAYRIANIPFSVIFQGPRAGVYEVTCAVGVCWVCSHAFP